MSLIGPHKSTKAHQHTCIVMAPAKSCSALHFPMRSHSITEDITVLDYKSHSQKHIHYFLTHTHTHTHTDYNAGHNSSSVAVL